MLERKLNTFVRIYGDTAFSSDSTLSPVRFCNTMSAKVIQFHFQRLFPSFDRTLLVLCFVSNLIRDNSRFKNSYKTKEKL